MTRTSFKLQSNTSFLNATNMRKSLMHLKTYRKPYTAKRGGISKINMKNAPTYTYYLFKLITNSM
jgi:hypothetical protein